MKMKKGHRCVFFLMYFLFLIFLLLLSPGRPTAVNDGKRRPTQAHSSQRRPMQAHEDGKGIGSRYVFFLYNYFILPAQVGSPTGPAKTRTHSYRYPAPMGTGAGFCGYGCGSPLIAPWVTRAHHYISPTAFMLASKLDGSQTFQIRL